LYGAFVWARRALNSQKRRFPVRAVRLICFDRLQKLVLIIFQITLDPNFVSFMTTTIIILIGFAFAFLCRPGPAGAVERPSHSRL
jgi:hypothetical protein